MLPPERRHLCHAHRSVLRQGFLRAKDSIGVNPPVRTFANHRRRIELALSCVHRSDLGRGGHIRLCNDNGVRRDNLP